MTKVFIDQDATTLGPDATRADLKRYSANLAKHLEKKFGRDIEVETCLGGGRTPCPSNDAIDKYVRELEASDGWIDLLD